MKLTKNYLRGLIQEQLHSSLNENQQFWDNRAADRVRGALEKIKNPENEQVLKNALETLATHADHVHKVLDPLATDIKSAYNKFHDYWFNNKRRKIDLQTPEIQTFIDHVRTAR